MVESDVRRRHFIDLRFRAFSFVTEAEVLQFLGPGPHDEKIIEQARDALLFEDSDRRLTKWLEEASTRVTVRRLAIPEPGIPLPFSK